MDREDYLLADIPNFGRVFDCGACGNIHLSVGPVSLTLAPDAYMQLVTLIHTSAANFETWLQNRQSSSHGQNKQEGIHAERDTDTDPA